MRFIAVLLLAMVMIAGCRASDKETSSSRHKAQRTEESRPSEKDQIESEVREGGLKDPGGARSLRDEANQQQQQQQEEADHVDQ